MLRTPVKLHELLIGKPMPFDVFDCEGRLLLRRGYVIESEQEKQKLFRLGPERDVSTDERFRAAFSSAARLEDKGSDKARRSVILPFAELHLLPGEPLQAKLAGDEEALWSRYIGMIRNRSLLIETVTRADLPIFIKEGVTLQIRGTTGSLAFLFTASVVANMARFPTCTSPTQARSGRCGCGAPSGSRYASSARCFPSRASPMVAFC